MYFSNLLWRGGWPLIGFFLIQLGCHSAAVQGTQPANPNIACMIKLPMPRYPLLAAAARIQGTITAHVILSPKSSLERVELEPRLESTDRNHLFAQPIQDAVRHASFKSDCKNMTVTLIFHFVVSDTEREYPQQELAYAYPNHFWISIGAPHWQP
jgi:hypothetical protein